MIRRYSSTKERRRARVRAKIKGTFQRPRLSIFRSNRHLYSQIIDDEKGKTLVAASETDLELNKKKRSADSVIKNGPKTERARLIGQILAQKALEAGVKKVVFDRGSYQYHGRVRALAEGARKGGLEF